MKKQHGGARKGAGRPVTKEPTVVMRIPISKVEAVKKLINWKAVFMEILNLQLCPKNKLNPSAHPQPLQ